MSLTHSLQPGLSALTEFSATLTRAIGSLDDSASELQHSFKRVAGIAEETQRTSILHEERLKSLEHSQELFRKQLEEITLHPATTIVETAVRVENESIPAGVPTASRPSLDLKKSIEATHKEAQLFTSAVPLAPNASVDETLKHLSGTVNRLEQQLKLQVTVNESLNNLVSKSSSTSVVAELDALKEENTLLKQKLQELCESQNLQNKHVLELLRSVGSRTRMEALQEELIEVAKYKLGVDHEEIGELESVKSRDKRLSTIAMFKNASIESPGNDTVNSRMNIPERKLENEKDKDEENKSVDVGNHRPLTELTTDGSFSENVSPKNKQIASVAENVNPKTKPIAATTTIVDENGDADEIEGVGATTDADEQTGNAEPTVQKTVKKTIIKKRLPSKIVHEQVVIEEEEEEEQEIESQRTIVIRKKIRQRKPKREAETEEESEEEEEENDDDLRAPIRGSSKKKLTDDPKDMPTEDIHGSPDGDNEDSATIGFESLAESQLQRCDLEDFQQQLQQVIEEKLNAQNALLADMRDTQLQRLDDLEREMATFKRIAFSVTDLRTAIETLQQKINTLSQAESLEAKQNARLKKQVEDTQDCWNKVYNELTFALDNVNDLEMGLLTHRSHAPDGDSSPQPAAGHVDNLWDDSQLAALGSKAFFLRAKDLSKLLEEKIQEVYPRDDAPQTLQKVCPPLREIFMRADQLLRMDERARDATALDYCFDDLQCADLTRSMRKHVVDAVDASLLVLDGDVSSFKLNQQLEQCIASLDSKADKGWVVQLERELRSMLLNKTEHSEFALVTSRLASSAEVQRMQNMIMDGTIGNGLNRGRSEKLGDVDLRTNLEFNSLLERLESLTNKFVDLKAQCDKLVPKEEVHEALKAVVEEVKSMRRSYVSTAAFKESLKSKADTDQVEKILKGMTEVLGDFNFAEFVSDPAAFHAKCLMCDKPVSARARTARKDINFSKTMPALDDNDIAMRHKFGGLMSASQSLARLSSPAAGNPRSSRARINSDLIVSRAQLDSLPQISDTLMDSSNIMLHSQLIPTSQQPEIAQVPNYKSRVRTSAGGGVTPTTRKDQGNHNTSFGYI